MTHVILVIRGRIDDPTRINVQIIMNHSVNDIRVKQYKGRAQCDAVSEIIAIMMI